MALSDYRLCDVCGGKAFYDANLNYHLDAPADSQFRVAGQPGQWGHGLDYVGDWAVLCDDCAKTHRCVIVPIADSGPLTDTNGLIAGDSNG